MSVTRPAPNRDLGQNFLVDPNILGVIERAAQPTPEDVVLEVGGGLGVLSAHVAPLVAHLHVVELDGRLEEPLTAALAPFDNTTLHWGDALRLDLDALDPAPTAMVANLPYGIAAPLVLDTIADLPSVERWLVMVQREVGERFAAAPGTKAYGLPSVLAQLSCEVKVVRAIPRTVFSPPPRVDSVLVRLVRRGPAAPEDVRALAQAAFAHRRKALAGSLALAPGAAPGIRERAREALAAIGQPARRPRRAPRAGGLPRAGAGAGGVKLSALAPGKVNLALLVGPTRPDGLHELVSLVQSLSLADELDARARGRRRRRRMSSSATASRGPTSRSPP